MAKSNSIKSKFLKHLHNVREGRLEAFRDNILNKRCVCLTYYYSLASGPEKRLYLNEDSNIVLCQNNNCIEFSLGDWWSFHMFCNECLV